MFGISKKSKCPICQMDVSENAISKYGEKFCSENCVREYEKNNQIASDKNAKNGKCGCCS